MPLFGMFYWNLNCLLSEFDEGGLARIEDQALADEYADKRFRRDFIRAMCPFDTPFLNEIGRYKIADNKRI